MFFFFNDTATTEISTLSLHDALPISVRDGSRDRGAGVRGLTRRRRGRPRPCAAPHHRNALAGPSRDRKEHTSELQSRQYLVCRLLLEKKKTKRPFSLTTVHSSSRLQF